MRILTRYILSEVVSHALIGAAVFTFVLFTRHLGRLLELVVRKQRSAAERCGSLLLHRPHLHDSHGRAFTLFSVMRRSWRDSELFQQGKCPAIELDQPLLERR